MVPVFLVGRSTLNSFQELNFPSNIGVPYEDNREYTITFSPSNPINTIRYAIEDEPFTANVGIDITNVLSTPRPITYSINVSSLANANVAWTSVKPDWITATTPSSGIYTLSNVNSSGTWDLVKSAEIYMPKDFANTWSYTSTITYPRVSNILITDSKTWTTTVYVTDLPEISTPGNLTYDEGKQTTFSNVAQITDVDTTGTFICNVAPSVASAVYSIDSTGGGSATTSFDSNFQRFTITGNKNNVNTKLTGMRFIPGVYYKSNFSMIYTLTNPVTELVSSVSQNMLIGNTFPELSPAANVTYNQNTTFTLGTYPSIADDTDYGSLSYNVNVAPSTTSAISTLSSAGSGGTSSFNSGTKTLTLTGNRTQVNTHLASITVVPATNYVENYTLIYTPVSPGGSFVTQNILIGARSLTLTNASNITYDEDVIYSPLPGTPTISVATNYGTYAFTMNIAPNVVAGIDTITSTSSYTGATFNANTKVYSIVGNSTVVNDYLSKLVVYPGRNYTTSFLLNYSLTNVLGGATASASHKLTIANTHAIIGTPSNVSYDINSTISPGSVAYITETPYDANDQYTVLVRARHISNVSNTATTYIDTLYGNANVNIIDGGAGNPRYYYNPANVIIPARGNVPITLITSTGSGTGAFDSNTKTYSITGNKATVNSNLENIKLIPGSGYNVPFDLDYSILPIRSVNSSPWANTTQKFTACVISIVDTITSNIILTGYPNEPGVTTLLQMNGLNPRHAKIYSQRSTAGTYPNARNPLVIWDAAYGAAGRIPQIVGNITEPSTYRIELGIVNGKANIANIGFITTSSGTVSSRAGWNDANLTYVTSGNISTVNSVIRTLALNSYYTTDQVRSEISIGNIMSATGNTANSWGNVSFRGPYIANLNMGIYGGYTSPLGYVKPDAHYLVYRQYKNDELQLTSYTVLAGPQ